MAKIIIVEDDVNLAKHISAVRLGTFQSCQWRSSDINIFERSKGVLL